MVGSKIQSVSSVYTRIDVAGFYDRCGVFVWGLSLGFCTNVSFIYPARFTIIKLRVMYEWK